MSNAFSLDVTSGGIAWLVLDVPGEKVNILASKVLEELDRRLDDIADRNDILAVAIVSGKPGTFIAGADIVEIGAIETAELGEAASRRGQTILHRLGHLGKPTLAAIDGVCLGGGLELALACHFRLATDSARTRLGLPEVKLGIIPGFGGTQRLPRLLGFIPALELILTGKTVDARRAERLGLVDRAIPAAYLRREAESWLGHAVTKSRAGHPPARLRPRRRHPLSVRLAGAPPVRPVVELLTKRRLLKQLHGDYPAPGAALHAVEEAFHTKIEKGLEHEAALVGPLLVSPTAKSLTWLFSAGNEARREGSIIDPASGRAAAPRPIRRAALLGAGVMGGGIADLLASQSIPVRMKDVDDAALLKGLKHAADLVGRQVRRRRIDRREGDRRLARIAPTLTYDGFAGVDIVIEAVVENLELKRHVLAEADAVLDESAVFATNTSSLPIAEIARGSRHPERVVGLHFFNPVDRMPLVEVIAGPDSSPTALATAHSLARRLGKTPIVVSDTPGFLVNRILMSYLAEALRMFVEGSDPALVDRAMIHFGMPMGPFALIDQVGFDTASKASKAIEAINERWLPRASVLTTLIESGRLGAKNGKGFYRYRKGRAAGIDRSVNRLIERSGKPLKDFEAIQTRLYLPMVNESVRCLRAGVARSAADLDLGMVLGTGFPPFRGGPLRNADIMGLAAVVERMNALAEILGERISPDPDLVRRALSGEKFYPAGHEQGKVDYRGILKRPNDFKRDEADRY